MDTLDDFKQPRRDSGGFLRACISGKYDDEQRHFVLCKIEKGQLEPNMNYVVQPSELMITVKRIEDLEGQVMDFANCGENVYLDVEAEYFNEIN